MAAIFTYTVPNRAPKAGGIVARLGINRSLWIFALLQAISNLAYYALSLIGKDRTFMIVTIVIENFCVGLVTAGMLAFMMSVTNKRFSATQFALLSSLAAASRDVLVAPAGKLADSLGWPTFFLLTVAAILPAIILLPLVAPWGADRPTAAVPHGGETAPAEAA